MPRTAVVFLLLAPLIGLEPADHGIRNSELYDLVAAGYLADLQCPDFADFKTEIQSFYQRRSYTPVWTNHGAATRSGVDLIGVLTNASVKGLDPEDYDAARWADRLASLSRSGASPPERDLARFDLELTVSVMRYVSDLHFGKANPGLFHASFDLAGESDLAGFVDLLADANDVTRMLDGVEPPFEGYRRTESALEKYLALAREDAQARFTVPTKVIEPGDPYPEAAQLASLLERLDDLPLNLALPASVYSAPLVAAVKHFQSRHGLDPDGRIGKATLTELNTPLAQRVRQLQLTLERWRWVPHAFSRPPIVVNIPEFELRALDVEYRTELQMKVVVGKAFQHQTPVFAGEMKSVVFRPYWEVPLSIQRDELAPKLDQDRSYFLKNHFEVMTANNKVVSAGAMDDTLLARIRSGELRVRQAPGPENSLGLVKFLFPNQYDVYMHATPATELFSRTRRDFSHGCIRVEKPVELAEWVLRDKPEWTRERILSAMNGDRTAEAALDRPIPVLIVYATAVVLSGGEVHFFDDIYGQDAQLKQALAKSWRCASATSAGSGPNPRE